jgi:hypothetical protein
MLKPQHLNLWNNKSVNKETSNYITRLENDKKTWFLSVFNAVYKVMPPEIEEGFQYGMPSFYVSLKHYPQGYHVGKNVPLPFLAMAYQKHYLAIYFMPWMSEVSSTHDFKAEYKRITGKNLNAGKVCLRFRQKEDLPLEWLEKVLKSVSIKDWIELYEKSYQSRDRKSRKTSLQDNRSNT